MFSYFLRVRPSRIPATFSSTNLFKRSTISAVAVNSSTPKGAASSMTAPASISTSASFTAFSASTCSLSSWLTREKYTVATPKTAVVKNWESTIDQRVILSGREKKLAIKFHTSELQPASRHPRADRQHRRTRDAGRDAQRRRGPGTERAPQRQRPPA